MAEASIDAQKRCGLCVYCVTLACQSLRIIDGFFRSRTTNRTAQKIIKTNNDVRTANCPSTKIQILAPRGQLEEDELAAKYALISIISVPASAVRMVIGLHEVKCHKDEYLFHLLSAIYCESSVFLQSTLVGLDIETLHDRTCSAF